MLCEYFSRSTCCVGPTPDQFADPKRQLRHACGAIRNFAKRCFTESINAYLAGDTATGKAILRDLVNATIVFEGLAAETRRPSKSLHRMRAPRGNPNTENFSGIVSALQKKTRVRLRVMARST